MPPWNLKKMTSYAAVLQHTLKFSLAPSALATDTLYFSLKRAKKRENFRLRLRLAEKWSIFCTARRKRVNFLKRRWFCPPLEKFLRAPMGPALKALHVHTVDAQAGSRLVTRYIVCKVIALTSRQCRLVAVTTDSIQNHV